jgi:hypothetical protein
MRTVRPVLALAVTAVAAVMCTAQPPFAGTPITPAPLAVALLDGIDDPVVVADLKLKEDQVKALVARRRALWDEAYTSAPKKLAETAAERTRATDELLKKTLTADQYKRSGQLAAQNILRGFTPPGGESVFQLTRVSSFTLNRYPELVAAFKLTDEQKKLLEAPAPGFGGFGGPGLLMSTAQADAAKEYLGPVAKTWTARFDPRDNERPFAPAGFNLLEAKDVRADLKLTEAEGKTFLDLGEKWQQLNIARQTDLSPKDADAQGARLKAETEKALAALTPQQTQRLKQIQVQVRAPFGGPGGPGSGFGGPFGGPIQPLHIDTAYTNPTVVKELALTEEQTKELAALRDAFRKDAAAVLEAATEAAAATKKLDTLVAARRTKAEGALTADQKAKWKELVGEPFTGITRPDRFGGAGGPGPLGVETIRAALFGKHALIEFNLLATNKAVQEELKMDEKQIKKAAELLAGQSPGIGGPGVDIATAVAERSKTIGEEVGKLLNEDQAKRFRQLMLQYSETRVLPKGARTTIIPSAVTYPGVAEAVKLTDEQKKKLLDGTAPAEVLTDTQKSAIKGMLGEPFKGGFTLTFPGGGPGLAPSARAQAAMQLFMPADSAAAEALKLTDEQVRKLAEARAAYQKVVESGGGFGVGPVERRAATVAFEKALEELLNADQKARFEQLILQRRAATNLLSALTTEEMVKRLILTKEQTDKLTALNADALDLHQLRTTHIGRAGPMAEDALGMKMRDAADERLLAVLTDAQKKTWTELVGEPLKGLRKTIPFGRGPGGGFGGGGFGGPGGG